MGLPLFIGVSSGGVENTRGPVWSGEYSVTPVLITDLRRLRAAGMKIGEDTTRRGWEHKFALDFPVASGRNGK